MDLHTAQIIDYPFNVFNQFIIVDHVILPTYLNISRSIWCALSGKNKNEPVLLNENNRFDV